MKDEAELEWTWQMLPKSELEASGNSQVQLSRSSSTVMLSRRLTARSVAPKPFGIVHQRYASTKVELQSGFDSIGLMRVGYLVSAGHSQGYYS